MLSQIEKSNMDRTVNSQIFKSEKKEVALGLSYILADTYFLYLKSQNYHWNVTGPQFAALHALFEIQYLELAAAVDLIAERIRALGEFAPGTFRAFLELSTIKEERTVPSTGEMIKNLMRDHEKISEGAKKQNRTAIRAHDEVTSDLLINRMQFHQKQVWMLKSILE